MGGEAAGFLQLYRYLILKINLKRSKVFPGGEGGMAPKIFFSPCKVAQNLFFLPIFGRGFFPLSNLEALFNF